jgi:RHS repeat-associated protein
VGTAVMGKLHEPDGLPKGDSLLGFAPDLTDDQLDAFFAAPGGQAGGLLKDATSRIVYDIGRYASTGEPAFAATIVRETHVADLPSGQSSKLQVSFSHSDGFGREIQKKVPAEAGPVEQGGVSVEPRWVGTGWTIFNNKGKPVRQYEPFFTTTHAFEFAVQRGVSPTLFYDPTARVIATLHPNQTYDKVLFDPWWQQSWDVNDTVTLDPAADPDVSPWFSRLDPTESTPSWYALRTDPAYAAVAALRWPDPAQRAAETDAAVKAAAHAGTPGTAHLDTLGRTFLTLADNGAEGVYGTRVTLDLEGNQRAVIDALGRTVVTYDYDMLSGKIHQASMEAGERWMLSDAARKPLQSWDSRGHRLRVEYDGLHRPLRSFVRGADPGNPGAEILFGRTVYGEGQPDDVALNLRTRPFRQLDCAGAVTTEAYDFKGNPLRVSRRLAQDYKATPDWSGSPALESETFTTRTTYDALNRPTTVTTPDASIYRPTFNAGNLLETVDVQLQGAQAATAFVTNIDYDAKGQRELIAYGNGATTEYEHDPQTFRLIRLKTTRSSDHAILQDLRYAYDPIGNITQIRDGAQQTIYFSNQVVTPDNAYVYDPLYRLIQATGREHIGQLSQPQTTWDDRFRVNLPQPGDGPAMRRYNEQYRYDQAGNFLQLIHQAANGNWTRSYAYDAQSLIEPAMVSNRLSGTTVGTSTETYDHDAHGNMTAMPHLTRMEWDFRDQLSVTSRQVVNEGTGETTYYVYDGAGQRVRKVTERQNGTRTAERIYLGGFEIYREYDSAGTGALLERQTLQVTDDKQRVAMVETRTQGDDGSVGQLVRFQCCNHVGSTGLELDALARVISYEEYYPHGSTSFQAVRSQIAAPKRYRYTGKERDEETGFAYHGARYYALWLGRWTAADPAGLTDGANLYRYCRNSPIVHLDPDGTETIPGEATGNESPEEIKAIAKEAGFGFRRAPTWSAETKMWDFGEDNLYKLTTRFDPGPLELIPSGPYATNPHSGGDYDPLAPKGSQKRTKQGGGGSGGGDPGGGGSGGGSGSGKEKRAGAPGGSPTGKGTTKQTGSGSTPGTGTEGGSGSEHRDGWLPAWVADVIEVALVAVMVVAAVATITVFATAFFGALAVEGTTIGTAATLAAGETIVGGGATVGAGIVVKETEEGEEAAGSMAVQNTTPNPVLTDSPYNPDTVAARVRPPYVPNPAHDPTSPFFDPTKTPEPSDAASVYAGAARAGMGTWFGRGATGWYRYFYDRAGGSHFSGTVPDAQVPIDIRRGR